MRRIGVDVTVFEQAAQFARIGAGIQIGCNAMKVLPKLGLEQRLRAQSFYPRSQNNRDWRIGEVKFDVIFGESAERKFGAPFLLAHRGDQHAALASAVPDECIRLVHKLVGLDETADGIRSSLATTALHFVRKRYRGRTKPSSKEPLAVAMQLIWRITPRPAAPAARLPQDRPSYWH